MTQKLFFSLRLGSRVYPALEASSRTNVTRASSFSSVFQMPA